MIFDGHGDIWTDVTVKREAGEEDIFKKFHLERYKKGEVNGGIFVIWIDPPNDENPEKRALEIIKNMSVEITNNKDIFTIIKKHEDMVKTVDNNKMPILIGCEGLSYIGTNIDYINTLYLLGVRHASLTWNEENDLATGVRGNPERGLTTDGGKAIKRLEELGIIVDVSHANDKTFWDIYNIATKPFIASHSNCRSLCKVSRNLTDKQLLAIKEKGGLVGLNAFPEFIADDPKDRDLEHLVGHLDHIVELIGIDYVGLGFDFCDYLTGETLNSFTDGDAFTMGLEDITKVPKLIQLLEKKGYSSEDIDKIKYKNFSRIIKEILG